jgi:hypothetical protein
MTTMRARQSRFALVVGVAGLLAAGGARLTVASGQQALVALMLQVSAALL